MKYFFMAELTAHIEMPDKHLEHIMACCSNHYDGKVQSSVIVGGFLYGLKNRRDFSGGRNKILDLTNSQIGLIIKSMELNTDQVSRYLCDSLYQIAMELMEKNKEINSTLLKK